MSKINCFFLTVVLCLSLSIARSKSVFAGDSDLTAEQVVAEHIKSIGSPAALAEIKSRAFLGTVSAEFFQGMHGSMTGTSMLVSEGKKLGIVFKFGDINNYPGEYFAFDGNDVSVGYISPGQKSPLADFIFRYNGLMKAGLMGGVLSGAWPLLDQEKTARLKCRKVTADGSQLYEIEYRPNKGLGDVKIKMYFDSKTFYHVKTEYQVRIKDDNSVRGPEGSVRPSQGRVEIEDVLPESIYVLVEKFDDFKKVGTVVLPCRYRIEYSVDGQGGAFVGRWEIKAAQWSFNNTYDDRIFKAQK